MKIICCAFLILSAMVTGGLAIPTAAQSTCPQQIETFVPTFPPYAFGCYNKGAGVFGMGDWWCSIAGNCPPYYANQEVCLQCLTAGSPISLATGNTFIEEVDVKVPGLSNGLSLMRTWNSMWPTTQTSSKVGLFGPNWRSNFEERIFAQGDGYMKYARGDGSFWSFYSVGASWSLAAPQNVIASLVQGTSSWTLTFQNGEKRTFDINSGALTSIVDRNGNATQISYDSTGRLTTVTDPAGRHLYFAYQNSASTLVTSVTSDVGIALTYAYDGLGRLTLVTKPDLTTISFQYNSQSLISAVLDSSGKVLEAHTYDSLGRGLTSSRAGGVDSVTITYPNE
jgi:YD repeat-containing protein